MEYLKKHGLAGLHGRLLRIGSNAKFSKVPNDIVCQMESLEPEVRELLINTAEIDNVHATLPLFVASTKCKEEIVATFLDWGAKPTVELFEELFTHSTDEARAIVLALVPKTSQEIAEQVFWMACRKNETHIGAMVLSVLACPFENFHEVMVACGELVAIIYQYSPSILGVRNERIAGLLLAAICEQGPVLSALLNPANPTLDEKKRITLVYGAANVLAEKFDQGRTMWRVTAETYGEQCCLPAYKTVTEIGLLEDFREFRTSDEVDEMDEQELLVQALMVIERQFGRGMLLLSALLARPYTEMLCVYSLQLMIRLDKLTFENLHRLDDVFTRFGLYRHAKMSTVLDLLDCCLVAISSITSSSYGKRGHSIGGQRPASEEYDDQLLMDVCSQTRGLLCRMERQRPVMSVLLTEFIAKVAMTLKWAKLNLASDRLAFVLRRIVRACHVMNNGPSLTARLHCLQNEEQGGLNIIQILSYFHAI